jgi:predicted DNA-binding transcriptional regulator AlpA
VQRNAPDRLADTVDEFCAGVGISRRHFYALRRRGEGPPTVTVGRRHLIRRAAGELWLQGRERATR